MVDGVKRKVLMHADRNGFLYTLDRTNGKLIAANPYVKVNWAERIDLTTARPVETDVAKRLRAGEKVEVKPRWTGGKNWMPMAFNPNTGRLYLAMLEETSVYQLNKELPVYKAGERYMGVENTTAPRTPGEPWGYFGALDPLTARPKWKLPLMDLPSWSGMLATAGGLVFSGRSTGEFVAIDEDTGSIVWQFKTGSGINAADHLHAQGPAVRQRALGARRRDLGEEGNRGQSASRWIGLDVCPDARLNRAKIILTAWLLALAQPASAQDPFKPEQVKSGSETYARHCAPCHGPRMADPEGAPDLRKFPRDQRERFLTSVSKGKNSMPPWGDLLKADEIEALWAYVATGGRN